MGFFNVQKGDAPLFHPVALNLHHLHGQSISLRLCRSAQSRRLRFFQSLFNQQLLHDFRHRLCHFLGLLRRDYEKRNALFIQVGKLFIE